ncbi:Hypothetical protein PACV_262 [Pacmanvirus A23]|uniref:Hypothetical protein n=1 Tax=Pacmanvirus A23 TaxID=1932881 RepID=UPI000A0939E0|nr:Hypothetical protein B9W72_gp260 [Pacmanvirus A23]SIP85977.1 Hypothetical protein PACV_262 [Pacmanvirus A23]
MNLATFDNDVYQLALTFDDAFDKGADRDELRKFFDQLYEMSTTVSDLAKMNAPGPVEYQKWVTDASDDDLKAVGAVRLADHGQLITEFQQLELEAKDLAARLTAAEGKLKSFEAKAPQHEASHVELRKLMRFLPSKGIDIKTLKAEMEAAAIKNASSPAPADTTGAAVPGVASVAAPVPKEIPPIADGKAASDDDLKAYIVQKMEAATGEKIDIAKLIGATPTRDQLIGFIVRKRWMPKTAF